MSSFGKEIDSSFNYEQPKERKTSFKAMNNEEFFREVIETWGLEELMLR
jgi:hypothetical protein